MRIPSTMKKIKKEFQLIHTENQQFIKTNKIMTEELEKYTQIKNTYNTISIKLQPISDGNKHNFDCKCRMCNQYQFTAQKKLMKTQEYFYSAEFHKVEKDIRLFGSKDKSYLETIIQRLLIPSNKIVSKAIEIFIPETCFFRDGQPEFFYFCRDFYDYNIIKVKKEKINTTFMQKNFNERRRKYRDTIKKLTKVNEKPKSKPKKLFPVRKDINKKHDLGNYHSAIVRYTDGSQTLFSENDLIQLFAKRKQDPAWKKVYSIKNYVAGAQAEVEFERTFIIQYNLCNPFTIAESIEYPLLFKRAMRLMQVYSEKIISSQKQYISQYQEQVFTKKLQQKSSLVYSNYMVYKLIFYIEEFYDEKIEELRIKIFCNEINQCYIIDVLNLRIKELVKFNWTNEIYKNRVETIEYEKYHKKQINLNPEHQKIAQNIQKAMHNEYEELKQKNHITSEPKEDTTDKKNNQLFAILYPSVKIDLKEVLTKDMPLQKFRRQFLGKKTGRKSIIKPFTSNFISQIHEQSPRLIRSNRNTINHKLEDMYSTLNANNSHNKKFRVREASLNRTIDF